MILASAQPPAVDKNRKQQNQQTGAARNTPAASKPGSAPKSEGAYLDVTSSGVPARIRNRLSRNRCSNAPLVRSICRNPSASHYFEARLGHQFDAVVDFPPNPCLRHFTGEWRELAPAAREVQSRGKGSCTRSVRTPDCSKPQGGYVRTRSGIEAARSDEEAIRLHQLYGGKMQVVPKCPIKGPADFSVWYEPGAAAPCRVIHVDPAQVYELTNKANLIAILTDGPRVLGLGNIGPQAGLPVMEGKAMLFKYLGGVDAAAICLGTQDEKEFIRVARLRGTFLWRDQPRKTSRSRDAFASCRNCGRL